MIPITTSFCDRVIYYIEILRGEPNNGKYLCHDIFRLTCDIIESRLKIYGDSLCSFDYLLLLFLKHNPNVTDSYIIVRCLGIQYHIINIKFTWILLYF